MAGGMRQKGTPLTAYLFAFWIGSNAAGKNPKGGLSNMKLEFGLQTDIAKERKGILSSNYMHCDMII